MIIAFDDVRVPAFVGFAMAMWISPFLIAGSIAALFGAPEAHSPLVLTLLFTSVATASVSVLTSSLDGGRTSAKSAENRSVSTFIFVNSAGTMVGLITNLSESVERWEPAGPNGLTFMYASMFREQTPLLVYVLLLVPMILTALYFVVRGSALLSAREHPSDEDLAMLGSWSGSLLALWIFTCMRWQPLSWGAETVAATWTAVVYAAAVIVGAWLYGMFGLRVVRWLAKASFELARGATEVLCNPKTWRAVILAALVTGALIGILFAAFLFVGWLAAGIAVVSDHATSEQVHRAFRSYVNTLLWTLPVLAKGGAAMALLLGLIWMPSLLRELWKGAASMASVAYARFSAIEFRVPQIQIRLGWLATGFLWGWRMMLRAVAARRRVIVHVLAVAVPSMAFLAASTSGLTVLSPRPERPFVDVEPSETPLEPISSTVPASITTVSFEPVSLCDISAGAAEWAYESDTRVSVALSDCGIRAAIGADEALLVIAMSTNGVSEHKEEARSRRRLESLMAWANHALGSEALVYGLDLGMASRPKSHLALSGTFGVSWSERPLLGLIVRSNSGVSSDTVRLGVVELLRQKQALLESYSRCEIRIVTYDGSRRVDDCAVQTRAKLASVE